MELYSNGISPFVFHSTRHQRFEKGEPVLGGQLCSRTLILEKNTDGCSGYRLENGYGYIIRGMNDDTGQPQFSPKPMEVIKQDSDHILLRGYATEAMSPFGWIDYDLSDYGFEVFLENGCVKKCIMHMYDRNVRIEYY